MHRTPEGEAATRALTVPLSHTPCTPHHGSRCEHATRIDRRLLHDDSSVVNSELTQPSLSDASLGDGLLGDASLGAASLGDVPEERTLDERMLDERLDETAVAPRGAAR